MSKLNIQKLYEKYQSGDEGIKKECIKKLSIFIYFNYRIFFNTDQDTASDFFTSFFPKLRKIIDHYDSSLSPIFPYLKRCITSHFLICIKKQAYEQNMSSRIQTDYYGDGFSVVQEPTNPYSAEGLKKFNNTLKNAQNNRMNKRKSKKYFESILICKCALNFDDAQIQKLCELLNLDTNYMLRCVHYIRAKMVRVQQYESKYSEICFHNFYKKLTAEELLKKTTQGSYEHKNYTEKRKNAEKFWKNNIVKIQNIKRVPSNRLVATALNINRGTISKNLAKIRKSYYNAYYDEQK